MAKKGVFFQLDQVAADLSFACICTVYLALLNHDSLYVVHNSAWSLQSRLNSRFL